MAKKTLASIKQCPIDFLYLWATDSFISQLGSKAKIISEKKYNQQQTLWKTMAENSSFSSTEEGLKIYKQWLAEIATSIKDVYGMSPEDILNKLAMGEMVAGKNFGKGVYGVGETPSTTFVQNPNYKVDPSTGQIMAGDGKFIKQTPIYGADGQVSGYSCNVGGLQFQSNYENGQFVSLSFSDVNGVQTANGQAFDSSKGSFWQNANNYMPIINNVLQWVSTIVNSLFPGKTVLTSENTVPAQTEWVETENNNGALVAGGLLVGVAALSILGEKSKKKGKKEK